MTLDAQLESILFFKAEPISVGRLTALLGADKGAVEEGLRALQEKLAGRGVALLRHKDEVELRTATAATALIEEIARDELSREMGRAGAEALAIILYRGQAARRDIDWVRGVNSAFTLRELAARGLVRRVAREKRGFLYEPTPELLAHLGVERASELPEYEHARKELDEAMIDGAEKTHHTINP